MLRKALIIDGEDTKFIQGDQVEYAELVEENAKAVAANKEPARFERVLLGITKLHSQLIHLFPLLLSKKLHVFLQKHLLPVR